MRLLQTQNHNTVVVNTKVCQNVVLFCLPNYVWYSFALHNRVLRKACLEEAEKRVEPPPLLLRGG